MAGTATATRLRAWRDVDLARVKLDDSGKDGFKRSWIMLMPEGEYEHPQYGTLSFSRKKLQEFKQNFDNRVRKIDIALDANHDGDKATGWLEELALRDGGLWGLVRWTPLGQQLLKDQIYRYFSPEFGTYTDEETGKKFSNVIIGGALTNRPFLKSMDAIHLKERRQRLGFQRPGQYTKSDRAKIPAEDFAGPNRTFPIVTQQDVHDAARLVGHAANPATVKARIKAIAKRKGFSLPAAWEDEAGDKSAAASEGARTVTRKQSRKLADPEPEAEEQEQQDLGAEFENESDEAEDTLDVLGEDGADEEDDSDETDEESDELDEGDGDEETEQLAEKSAAKSKRGKKPANDEEDAQDGGADEDEELADDDMEYDEASAEDDGEDEVPAPRGKAGKGKGMPVKKMSETQLLAENRQLREEVQRLREESFKLSVSKKLSEFTRNIRSEGDDEEFALPRSFKLAYQEAMLAHGLRLSEEARGAFDSVILTALKVGTVPLVSLANKIESGKVIDADDRRPRAVRSDEERTEAAKKIALSEYKKPLDELTLAEKESIFFRVAEGRKGSGNSSGKGHHAA